MSLAVRIGIAVAAVAGLGVLGFVATPLVLSDETADVESVSDAVDAGPEVRETEHAEPDLPAAEPEPEVIEPVEEREPDPETTVGPTEEQATEPALADSFDVTTCLVGDDLRTARVAGVADFVNGRAGASTDTAVIAEVPRAASVVYDVDSYVWSGERSWFLTAIPDVRACAWIAATFLIADEDNRYLELPGAPAFVWRATQGLDASEALASMVPPDLYEPLEQIDPIELGRLVAKLAELRELGELWPDLVVEPDTGWLEGVDREGCYLSDTLGCELIVRGEPAGAVIATVSLSRTGDGWDGIWTQLA